MSKNNKNETKAVVKPSQSGVKRGQKEESKLPKILTGVGVGVLITLVVALIVALIVTTVLNKKPKDSPFKDLPHVTYENVESVVIDQQIAALNESASTRDAYNQLIKESAYIVFYRDQDLKNKQFVNAVLAYFDEADESNKKVGLVLFNLSDDDKILTGSSLDPILAAASEFSDPKLLPFVITVANSGTSFDFVGEMNAVLHLLEK